ncbi:MAG: NACHT domain-containing NTPase, partial [Crinalium sp.]
MAKRSLKASIKGIEKAKQALERNSWTQQDLANEVEKVRSTVSRFLAGQPVDRNTFHEICHRLQLPWTEIVDPPANLPEEAENNQGTFSEIDDLVQKVRSHPDRRDKIQEQCGRIRILDVEWLVGIDNIYIDVNILEKLPSNRYLDIADFRNFNPDTDSFDRLGLGKIRQAQVPGLEVATTSQKLMVLGKPGSGKTTFLKFLTVQCSQGNFQKELIPIFIEIKAFARKSQDINIFKYIYQELRRCGISEEEVENLLFQGRFLILLDGLDEVQAEEGSVLLTEVEDFSKKYFRNRFIITCRIAAQLATKRYALDFTDVEVADFNKQQIKDFAIKWFVAVGRNSKQEGEAKADQFLDRLILPQNQPIRELVVTPILLNLACLVFQEKNNFPSNRAKLYEQGLDILLQRWDISRGIKRDEVYRNLSLDQKNSLLSQVASMTFERGEYFFDAKYLQSIIADFIKKINHNFSELIQLNSDSEAVLKSLESQHGVLIARAQGIYSFSHLTFQEYFTSKNLASSPSKHYENLVKYITDKRWNEVFMLTASMLENGDNLLKLMKQLIDNLIASEDKLQNFLTWLSEKFNLIVPPNKRAALCSRYLELILYQSLEFTPSSLFKVLQAFDLTRTLDPFNPMFDQTVNEFAEPEQLADQCIDIDANLDFIINTPPDSKQILSLESGDFEQFKQSLHQRLTTGFLEKIQRLQELENQLPKTDINEWLESQGQDWIDQFRSVLIPDCNIVQDWDFNNTQKKLLQQYRDANLLLMNCMNSGCKVSSEVRQEIE